MVYCELSEQRKFWLCFNKDIITSDKTILLAESNSDPSIVESFLIDEKKTTLPLLISRVLQRLNGQKWIGDNWLDLNNKITNNSNNNDPTSVINIFTKS